jgi:NAD(P)H-nitrite reductase large subunit
MDINEKIKLTVKLTETCHTFKQIADEFYRRTGYGITQPTVGAYLKRVWGDEYASKRKNMIKRTRSD